MFKRHRSQPNDIILGTTMPPGRPATVALTREEQAYHATIWGRSGSGKSRFLQSLFLQYLNRGQGVCLIDPHHDLSYATLASLIEHGFYRDTRAYERLIYLDWGNGWVVPFNVLTGHLSAQSRALQVLEAMMRVWPELRRAPAFQTLVLSSLVVLAENKLPITYLHHLLADPAFRERCLQGQKDPLIKQALARLGKTIGSNQEAGSALRRAFLLSFHEITRLSLGQPDCVLDFRQLMDEGTSLIINLGNVPDQETRRLLGALLLVQIEQAALSRTDLAPNQRRPWTVLVDEWPAMAASSATLGSILDQTRKFGLRLYLAAQSTAQVDSTRMAGALENCRLTVAFGLGRDSALEQGKQLATPMREESGGLLSFLFPPPLVPSVRDQTQVFTEDLQILGPQEAYIKRYTEPPIKVRTLGVPDAHPAPSQVAEVLATYRRRYQRPKETAEAQLEHFEPVNASTAPPPPAFQGLFAGETAE
ncbi:MAG: hypothetical protein NVSMB52_01710 [Chloroflexota bacterium]